MKKLLLSILLIFSILFVGCSNPSEDNKEVNSNESKVIEEQVKKDEEEPIEKEPIEEDTEENIAEESLLLVDNEQIKVTLLSVVEDEFGLLEGYVLELENKTDMKICVQTRDTQNDGVMVEAFFSAELNEKSKAQSVLQFTDTVKYETIKLKDLGEIKTTFIVMDEGFNTLSETPITIPSLN